MLRDDIDNLNNSLVNGFVNDGYYNFSYNEAKKILKEEGHANAEPSRELMILVIINYMYALVDTLFKEGPEKYGFPFIRTLELTDLQKQNIQKIAQEADGKKVRYGSGAAGAGVGFLLGGVVGAIIGGLIGVSAGDSYNNQNRQKFYEVLRKCIKEVTESWYVNNSAYEKNMIDTINDFIERMKKFAYRNNLSWGYEEINQFLEDAYLAGYDIRHIYDQKTLDLIYKLVYKKGKN